MEDERRSEVLRNTGLLVAASVSGLLVSWRNSVLEKQATAAQQQAELGRRGALDDRYQRSTEMLASDLAMVRVGGIRALQNLALENPTDYLAQVVQILCAFVRHPTDAESVLSNGREDIRIAAEAAAACVSRNPGTGFGRLHALEFTGAQLPGVNLSGLRNARLDAAGADLRRADLSGGDLRRARLAGAILNGANCTQTDFSRADLTGSELTGCQLTGAILRDTDLTSATLGLDTEVFMSPDDFSAFGIEPDGEIIRGLVQQQLDEAVATSAPFLDLVRDARTRKPLVWQGESKLDSGERATAPE